VSKRSPTNLEGSSEEGPAKEQKKHTPGKGHRRKSEPKIKQRFLKKARARAQKQKAEEEQRREVWNRLTPEQRKLRPELDPDRQ
jgi:hypothetical protein